MENKISEGEKERAGGGGGGEPAAKISGAWLTI